jgi:hypothetical protein
MSFLDKFKDESQYWVVVFSLRREGARVSQ